PNDELAGDTGAAFAGRANVGAAISVANASAAISAFMIRLHFWTIVLDLCISAKADRPAPAVVRCLRNPRSGKTMFIPRPAHIRCAIGETASLARSIQANIFRSVLASSARPNHN